MLKSIVSLFASVPFCLAGTVTYNWDIDWVIAAPDGFSRQVIGINGQWPCPPIEATVGDTVVVKITNKLKTQSTGLHFHGIGQRGSNIMDGPTAVTQCPVPPGSQFTYTFKIDAPGSYWYHSHNMGQYPDGLRGPIIVHDPDDPYKGQYDEELILTTSDWYHDQVPLLLRSMFIPCNTKLLPPFPDSVLLNDANQAKFLFSAGKTYKISVISMAALGATFLQFESHTMRVIGVDGTYVKTYNANQIRIAPAQRYTFLLSTKPTADRNYAFLASLDINKDFVKDSAPVYKSNITGQIIYNPSNPKPPALVVHKWEPANDFNFEAMDDQLLLGTPDQSITLDFTLGFDALGIPRAYFNNITYVPQKVPSLFTALSTGSQNTNPVIYGTVNPFVLNEGDIVQIVMNNHDSAIHPFHLHGHQFQVCDLPPSDSGTFNGDTGKFPAIPMRRDVVAVNSNSYVVLRFQANNPGIWLFHCHIEWHVEMGLVATIIEAPEALLGSSIPPDHRAACDAQYIPTAGNAAGNTQNLTNMTGANTLPLNPNNGAIFSGPLNVNMQESMAN